MAKINKFPNWSYMNDEMQKHMRKFATKEGVEHFKKSFDDQGFVDVAFEPWENSYGAEKLLVDTGELLRSVQVRSSTKYQIVFGSDRKNAKIHNEGGLIKITKRMRGFFWKMYRHTRDEKWKWMALTKSNHIRIPKRQFIGESWYLLKKIEDETIRLINQKAKEVIENTK